MTDGDRHLKKIDEEQEEEDSGATSASTEMVTDAENKENNVSKLRKEDTIKPTENEAVLQEVAPAEEIIPVCIACGQVILPGLKSVQPCPCGYYVHTSCLLRGVQLYEATYRGSEKSERCNFCEATYNITPRKSLAVRVMEKSCAMYNRFCGVGYHVMIVVLVDTAFAGAGICLLYKIYGHKEAEDMLFSMDPVLAVCLSKAIPLISIGINFIPWEVKVQRFFCRYHMRTTAPRPRPAPVGSSVSTADRSQSLQAPLPAPVREVKYRRTWFGLMVGGLLLPWYGVAVGHKVFGAVSSPLLRFVLGSLTFVAVRGAVMIYYRHKLFVRQCSLRVAPYRGD